MQRQYAATGHDPANMVLNWPLCLPLFPLQGAERNPSEERAAGRVEVRPVLSPPEIRAQGRPAPALPSGAFQMIAPRFPL